MDTRMKLFALAFAAPLALAACDSGEEQQTAEVEEPATPPAGQEESAGAAQEPEDRQAAATPERSAEQPPAAAGEPAAPPEQETAQAPQPESGAAQPESGAATPAGGEMNFAGNWALEGEACPGQWEFTEQTIEIPQQGTFQVQDVQQNGQDVELEVSSTSGEQTQTLALEFPDESQPDTMIVRNGGDEVTLQRCQ